MRFLLTLFLLGTCFLSTAKNFMVIIVHGEVTLKKSGRQVLPFEQLKSKEEILLGEGAYLGMVDGRGMHLEFSGHQIVKLENFREYKIKKFYNQAFFKNLFKIYTDQSFSIAQPGFTFSCIYFPNPFPRSRKIPLNREVCILTRALNHDVPDSFKIEVKVNGEFVRFIGFGEKFKFTPTPYLENASTIDFYIENKIVDVYLFILDDANPDPSISSCESESPLENLLIAFFLEGHFSQNQALDYYQKAVDLAPGIDGYSRALEYFKLRNKM